MGMYEEYSELEFVYCDLKYLCFKLSVVKQLYWEIEDHGTLDGVPISLEYTKLLLTETVDEISGLVPHLRDFF